jgi:hypothetical protein
VIRCGRGEEPDPGEVARLVAMGYGLVRVAKVGWADGNAGFDHHYEKPAVPTPPRPIYKRK